jgi:hypothetical protein
MAHRESIFIFIINSYTITMHIFVPVYLSHSQVSTRNIPKEIITPAGSHILSIIDLKIMWPIFIPVFTYLIQPSYSYTSMQINLFVKNRVIYFNTNVKAVLLFAYKAQKTSQTLDHKLHTSVNHS